MKGDSPADYNIPYPLTFHANLLIHSTPIDFCVLKGPTAFLKPDGLQQQPLLFLPSFLFYPLFLNQSTGREGEQSDPIQSGKDTFTPGINITTK